MADPSSTRKVHPSALACVLACIATMGCNRPSQDSVPEATGESTQRQVVALGRLEPAGGVISISAVPGERIQSFEKEVVEGATVRAGAELARVDSFALRSTQLEAAETKFQMSLKQRERDRGVAEAQLEQALANRAQAEAKHQETIAQQRQLENLAEAAAIAQGDLQQLERLQASDPELVTDQQLRRRRNSAERASNEYEAAAAAYPHALEAAKQAAVAADANVRLARLNVELAETLDPSSVAELERRAAASMLDQSILRAPEVEGGSSSFQVLRVMMQPGEFVAQIPVLELGDTSKMVAIAEVYEADAKELSVGQPAVIRSPAFAGRFSEGAGEEGGIRATVTRIGSMVASPGLTNRNPLAPSDRSVVEVRVEIEPADADATQEAAHRVGLQVTVEFVPTSDAAAGQGTRTSR